MKANTPANLSQGSAHGVTVVAGFLILALLIAGLVWYLQQNNLGEEQGSGTEQAQDYAKIDFSPAEVLANFPSDLPSQTGNKILENYQVVSAENRVQSTKKFTTSLTEAQALALYTDFFASKDWLRVGDTAVSSPRLMKKGDLTLLMEVSKQSDDTTVVELIISQK